MRNILQQRRLLTRRYFEITGNSLKISVTKPLKYYEEEISFEEIGRKVFKNRSFNRFAIIGVVICAIGLLVTIIGNLSGDKTISFGDILFYIISGTVVTCLLLITAKNTTNLMLVDKRFVVFFSNSRKKESVADFIDLIFSEQKAYMLKKYAKREQFLSPERTMEQIAWLKDRDIIDETEFDKLKIELFPASPGIATIGFKFGSDSN